MPTDLIGRYIQLLDDTEVPVPFHRWSCIAGIGALLGNSAYYDDGLDRLNANLFVLLIAPPGAKKSTSIKIMKKLMSRAGYDTFAAARTSKEKFLMDLAAGLSEGAEAEGSALDQTLFGHLEDYGSLSTDESRECFITADEFTNFFGNNILDFVSILGELWDFKGTYSSRVKNSESILIPNPVISILSGSTPETIHENFPPNVIGQGFFSRLIFVFSEPSHKKIAFPTRMSDDDSEGFVQDLVRLRTEIKGEMKHTPEAKDMLERIYMQDVQIPDTRFNYYSTRRFAQLKKLCMIHAAADFSQVIDTTHVRRANTVLTHTEHFMPRALGALGQARNSSSMYKVLSLMERDKRAWQAEELWPIMMNDLSRPEELSEILISAQRANKIQITKGGGYMIRQKSLEEVESDLYDWEYLSDEERKLT